ncbi:anaphase-promoting complex subunit cdc20-like [Amphibalanus amphitrite]|uniref:anaphase-promoting complex subunit cdc20-like n=1 Tax=Amphibalanus amphitrite TaxID=1232801 RepID=UPI001C920F8E|nr:anaphase-promoting complex subunit cdc20-like [Amphibalanus amphitrite]
MPGLLDGYYLHLLAERKLFQLAGMALGSLAYAWDAAGAIIASLAHVENQADYISCSLIWAKEGSLLAVVLETTVRSISCRTSLGKKLWSVMVIHAARVSSHVVQKRSHYLQVTP